MANVIMALLDEDEVETILNWYFETHEDRDELVKRCMANVSDGELKAMLYDTLDSWLFEQYWSMVEETVWEWANKQVEE